MLPLVELTPAQIDLVCASVEGGAANVADVYPLAPLQEGIFFHHLLAGPGEADVYLVPIGAGVRHPGAAGRVPGGVAAGGGPARHLPHGDGVGGAARAGPGGLAACALSGDRGDPDRRAAMTRQARAAGGRRAVDGPAAGAADAGARGGRAGRGRGGGWGWCGCITCSRTTPHWTWCWARSRRSWPGAGDELPAPLPFRDFVAQARLGVSRAEHERFFAELLGDVTEPTLPFGLADAWRRHGRAAGAAGGRRRAGGAGAGAGAALGVSPATVFHVAWARVLASLAGRTTWCSGRCCSAG